MLRALILAGGYGTRIKEHTDTIPKPLVKANDIPLFIHIINLYKIYGVKNVTILAGFKIESFYKYCEKNFLTVDKIQHQYLINNEVNIDILDTGLGTMTGGRILQALDVYKDKEYFLTYGDGVSDVNIKNLYSYHSSKNSVATVTAVRPPARFGSLNIENGKVTKFAEKHHTSEGWINGGFFVIKDEVKNYIENNDNTIFEKEPLEKLAEFGELSAYEHNGFWQPVDTIRDLERLEEALIKNG